MQHVNLLQTCNYLRPGNVPNWFHLRSSIFDEWDRTCDALRHLFWSGLVWRRPEHHDLFPKNTIKNNSFWYASEMWLRLNGKSFIVRSIFRGGKWIKLFKGNFFSPIHWLSTNQDWFRFILVYYFVYIRQAQHSARGTNVARRKF